MFGGEDKEEAREVVVEVWQLRGDVFRGICLGVVKLVGVVVEGVIDRSVFRDDDE